MSSFKVGDCRMLNIELKCRADGFCKLYSWLNGRDALIVKADRQEPLVVVRLPLAAELINGADKACDITSSASISSASQI